ncbi:putative cytoplasmic protein [Gluconacetobacter sacchari DSM 12717]|uniref:Cytoplasmic protein n=1 Tax=Gluconacetobacter sacchari DSM 12717 TaxID=1307940 RepID=A0ABQ0P9Q5_9PROT|nr:putative cytoplasmic protein [Gluconacetobacter sacchari DSM 12717]
MAHAGKARRQPTGDVSHTGRGRPKLGVVAREVTLLPRHWEWLAAQPGGASQMLRRLVDQARRSDGGQTGIRDARERTYRFLSALAGNLPGFEEATRALFSGDDSAFAGHMRDWPADVKAHALMLARPLPAQKTGS